MRSSPDWMVRRNTGGWANWSLGERMVGLMETRGLACRDLYPIERVQIGQFPILLSESRLVTDAT